MLKKSEVRVHIWKKCRLTPLLWCLSRSAGVVDRINLRQTQIQKSSHITRFSMADFIPLVFMVFFAIVQTNRACFRNQFYLVIFGEKIKRLLHRSVLELQYLLFYLFMQFIQFIFILCLIMSEYLTCSIQDKISSRVI